VVLLFLWPPTTILLWMIVREIRETRRALRAFKLDAEASAAEGFPPPGPPTTDSLSAKSAKLQAPPNGDTP
jgi:hypothetical protein